MTIKEYVERYGYASTSWVLRELAEDRSLDTKSLVEEMAIALESALKQVAEESKR